MHSCCIVHMNMNSGMGYLYPFGVLRKRKQRNIIIFTSHGISKPSPSITSESCGPRTIVGGANTFNMAGGAA